MTCTTTENVDDALAARVAAVQEMVPVLLTTGSVPQAQPAGIVID
ncbi:MAG: hypothetical protein WBD19_00540 [Candidatus Acidiferrum sp.]